MKLVILYIYSVISLPIDLLDPNSSTICTTCWEDDECFGEYKCVYDYLDSGCCELQSNQTTNEDNYIDYESDLWRAQEDDQGVRSLES